MDTTRGRDEEELRCYFETYNEIRAEESLKSENDSEQYLQRPKRLAWELLYFPQPDENKRNFLLVILLVLLIGINIFDSRRHFFTLEYEMAEDLYALFVQLIHIGGMSI